MIESNQRQTLPAQSHKGKHHSPSTEFKKDQKGTNLGRKFSIEYKRKLSEAHKGKILPIEQRKKISASHKARREKSHLWKGGITPMVLLIRSCFAYRQWRSDVFTRDDYTCQQCGVRGTYLEADHYPKMFTIIFKENNIKSIEQALECAEFWNINNGRTLSRSCHDKTKLKN